MTRPTTAVLARLAGALDAALRGSNVDRVWRPTATTLLVDLRALGKRRLFVDLEQRHPRVVVTTRWPETPASPDRETLVLRKLLEGIRIAAVSAEADRRLVIACQPRHDATLRLVVQLAGRYPNVAVLDAGQDGAPELVRLVAERLAVDPDAPPLPSGPDPFAALADDAAWLEAHAAATWVEADARALAAARDAVLREVRAALDKVRRLAKKHEDELAASAEAEALRHRGDLLKTALHRVRAGDAAVEVVDWADPDGAAVVVALDPTKTPVENLERLFARYKKLVRTRVEAERRLEAAWLQDEALSALAAEVSAAATPDDVARGAARLRALGVRASRQAPPRRDDPSPRLPYRRFVTGDGDAVLVGRSARDNDLVTFRVASGRDLFLHARDVPGSHVILRVGGREPSQASLLDAATLAAWNSQARGEAVVDVLWTERKHVRKVPGVPGRVTTADARTLAVRVDQARVDRLYATLAAGDDETSP